MHQDATWYVGRPQPRRLCVTWGPSFPSPKGAQSPQCPLWPNDCMDYDGTWYGGRPRPRRLCVRWGPNYPQNIGHIHHLPVFGPCLLWPKGWMDEGAVWYGIYLGPGHIVLDGVPTLRETGTAAPRHLFSPCLLWPRSPISATAELL